MPNPENRGLHLAQKLLAKNINGLQTKNAEIFFNALYDAVGEEEFQTYLDNLYTQHQMSDISPYLDTLLKQLFSTEESLDKSEQIELIIKLLFLNNSKNNIISGYSNNQKFVAISILTKLEASPLLQKYKEDISSLTLRKPLDVDILINYLSAVASQLIELADLPSYNKNKHIADAINIFIKKLEQMHSVKNCSIVLLRDQMSDYIVKLEKLENAPDAPCTKLTFDQLILHPMKTIKLKNIFNPDFYFQIVDNELIKQQKIMSRNNATNSEFIRKNAISLMKRVITSLDAYDGKHNVNQIGVIDIFYRFQLYQAIKTDNFEQIESSIKERVNLNLPFNASSAFYCDSASFFASFFPANHDGMTFLQVAISLNRIDIVKLLIRSGANVNIPDNKGDRPLHTAVQNGNFDMIKLLIRHGANSQYSNQEGQTPLSLSAHRDYKLKFSESDQYQIVGYLFTQRTGFFKHPSFPEGSVDNWKFNILKDITVPEKFNAKMALS